MKASLLFASLLAFAASAFAQTPALMSYQGRVSDSSGTLIGATSPVNRTVTFKFYTAASGGNPVYAEAQTVTISAGEFAVLLGSGSGVATFNGPAAPANTPYITLPSIMTTTLYLGVTVDDGTAAADPEITPRQQIVSAAFAFRAKVAEGLVDNTLSTSMLQSSSVTTTKILDSNVTTSKIADANITTVKIQDGNITTAKIADNSVTTAKIAANSITGAKILDGSINSDDVAVGGLNGGNIADGTITSIDIADGTVATADLANSAVTNTKIADSSVDLNKLIDAVRQSLCPAGTIVAFGGDTIPAGWQLCDGTLLNRTNNPNLYNAIGTRFGYGDSSNFRVPDLRGVFLRGRDGGVGRDPDRGSRTASLSGGATGDAVGSYQSDMYRSHTHPYNDIYFSENTGATSGVTYVNWKGSGDSDNDNEPWEIGRTTSANGGNETRPINVYVNYIIKL